MELISRGFISSSNPGLFSIIILQTNIDFLYSPVLYLSLAILFSASLEIFENKIYVANTAEEFHLAINTAIQEDTEELHQARRQEAKRHSWHSRVDEMIDQISLKLDWK